MNFCISLLFLVFDLLEQLFLNKHIHSCHCFWTIKGKLIKENNDILIKTKMLGLSKKKVAVVSPIRMKLRTAMFVDIGTISLWLYDFLWLADDYSLFLYDCLFKTKNRWWKPYIYEIIRDRHLVIIPLSIYFFLAGFLFHMTFTIPRTAVKSREHF